MARMIFVERRSADGEILKSAWDRWLGNQWVRFYFTLGYMAMLMGLVIFSYLTAYNGMDFGQPFLAPRLSKPIHLFGTDAMGRDVFLRVIVSSKVIFVPGMLAICVSGVLGTILAIASGGIWRGYAARMIEFLGRSSLDVLDAFPKYVTLLLFAIIIPKPDFYDIALVLGILSASRMGKLILNQIEALKERDFVRSSEALGISKLDLVLRHILFYNCKGLYIIQAAAMMTEVILVEIALSYFGSIAEDIGGLGITVEPPMPSWGTMLVAGCEDFRQGPWISLFPTLFVVLSILVFYMLADSASNLFAEKTSES